MMFSSRISLWSHLVFILYLIHFCLVDLSVGESPTGDPCMVHNKSCGECVKVDGCAFCEPTKKCMTYKLVSDTLHNSCEGQDWKLKQCFVSGKILLIVLPVAGFVLLVILGCTIYCCCCRKKKARGASKDETKWRREREEIEVKHKQRREERQKKHDEIRKKYGLYKKGDSEEAGDGRYHRFDDAAVA
ncbi:pituitary tumor-transforming gene 1 protein-interacting protein-like [Montipora capricornis]|uniref:pituitary tumor-transforming gene 1 protein-interacting protein-like n=1 Tax=Montipora capricornis TaxID=246305 RepID=UPI0035F218F7